MRAETFAASRHQERILRAYANSHRVKEREDLYSTLKSLDPEHCFAFGACQKSQNLPFDAPGRIDARFNDFAFVIAMENVVKPGYMTEKIVNAFRASAIPIYSGANDYERFFNSDAVIDCSKYASIERVAETCIGIWRDPQKLMKVLSEPMCLPDSDLEEYEAVYSRHTSWQQPFVDILREAFPD